MEYSECDGCFTWKDNGRRAGTLLNTGYVQIQIDGELWLAHRLAWLYVHGEVPDELDHRNQNKSDNRIDNLRPVEHWMQIHNSKFNRKSKYGYRGISPNLNSRRNPWRAHTKIDGKYKYLGAFPTKELAARAYNSAIVARFKEFAGPLLNTFPV